MVDINEITELRVRKDISLQLENVLALNSLKEEWGLTEKGFNIAIGRLIGEWCVLHQRIDILKNAGFRLESRMPERYFGEQSEIDAAVQALAAVAANPVPFSDYVLKAEPGNAAKTRPRDPVGEEREIASLEGKEPSHPMPNAEVKKLRAQAAASMKGQSEQARKATEAMKEQIKLKTEEPDHEDE